MSQSRTRRATRDKATIFARTTRLGLLAAAALALLPGGPAADAQTLAPPPSSAPAATPAPAPDQGRGQGQRVADLTTRYRFIERYSVTADPEHPESIVQSRVALRETIKTEADNPKGAPERSQVVAQIIYTERPAVLGSDGLAAATVRRYDTFRLTPDSGARPSEPRPFEGLLLWYQLQPGGDPLVLCLNPDRQMREVEFSTTSRQVFLPAVATALPSLPSRIGDRWRVPRIAAHALLGEWTAQGEALTATFQDLRTATNGPDLVAIIAINGQLTLPSGPTAYNARLEFTFAPPASSPGEDQNRVAVDARGAISELRAAQVTTASLPGDNGRLKQTRSRELILARQRDAAATLEVPEPKPTPNQENSWITYVDPRKRFTFRYPQTFRPDPASGAESVELLRTRPDLPDVIGIQIQPRTGDPEADRRNLDPELHRKTLMETLRQNHEDVLTGAAAWLPEADWKSAGMKAFRIEAAIRIATGRATSIVRRGHLDYYLILTGRPESLVVTARTVQDPPTDFRKETEDIIKTFRFGPPADKR